MTTEISIMKQDLTLSQVSKAFTDSGYFKDAAGQAQAIVKILAGQELGLPPVASMQGIHIINGKPSLSASTLAALVKRSAKYDYRIARLTDQECTINFFEAGKPCGESSMTLAQAKQQGVQNLQKFPRNMLLARCISNGVKWFCPDLFLGPIYTPEELGAEVDPESGNPIQRPVAAPAAPGLPQASEPTPAPVSQPDDATAPQEAEEAQTSPAPRKPNPNEVQYLDFMQQAKAKLIKLLGEVDGIETYQAINRDNTGEVKSNAVLNQAHYLRLDEKARLGILQEIMNDTAGTIKTVIAQMEADKLDPQPPEAPAEPAPPAEGEPQTVGAILGENGAAEVITQESADLYGP